MPKLHKNTTSMKRRFYFETEETITKKKKGWIEIDMDFTQIYHCFSEISPYINSPTSWKLLFWLLSEEVNKNNVVSTGKDVWETFNNYLKSKCQNCDVAYRTFNNSINELVEAKALTMIGRGRYYLNPHIFWKQDRKDRIQFIQAEFMDGKKISHNPNDTGIPLLDE